MLIFTWRWKGLMASSRITYKRACVTKRSSFRHSLIQWRPRYIAEESLPDRSDRETYNAHTVVHTRWFYNCHKVDQPHSVWHVPRSYRCKIIIGMKSRANLIVCCATKLPYVLLPCATCAAKWDLRTFADSVSPDQSAHLRATLSADKSMYP